MTALIPFQQSSSSSSPPLLVHHAHLGRILTVLSDLTAACKILRPSLLARDNILQQLQHVWHVALQCALACNEMLLSTSSGDDLPSTSHDCCDDSNGSDAGSCAGGGGSPSSGGDSRSTSPSMSPTTNRSNNFPTRGVLENDTLEATAPSLNKTVPTTNLLGRQSAHERSESLPPCETYRRRSRRRTDGDEHDDNSDEPLLERTITGMLRTVSLAATCRGHSNEEDRDHEQREQRNKREDASAPNVPPHRSAAVASSYRASVPSSSTTMFKQQDQAEVDDEPSSSSPSSHHHQEEEAQLIDVQGNTTTSIIIIAFRRMCELIALAETLQKKIVGAVLAQYYSIALLSCTDSILRELSEWVQQIQQHLQPLSSMTAFMKNTMPVEYKNNNNNNCGSNQSGGTGGTNTANGVPFSLWMQLVVEAQPTVAATRLLCRSRDICIDGGSLEPSEALGAEGSIPPPPQEAPPPAASPLLGSTTTPLSASSSIDSRPPRERTSSFAGDARPSAPADVMFRYIVVAVRTVAPCGHAQECLGNRQLLFVQRHHQPSPVDDDDDDNENIVEDLSSTATVHTVLAAECSVGREFHNDDSDMQGHHHPWSSDSIFVVSGRLIEDRLSSEDRFQSASKIGHVVIAPYSSPILTAQENDQQLLLDDDVGGGDVLLRFPATAGTTGSAIDDDWMYAQHFPDAAPPSLEDDQRQRGGNDTEADSQQNSRNVTAIPLVPITFASDGGGNIATTTTRNDSCPRPPGGLRAGDAMFMAELTSRLEFWMERGSIPRDFDEDFRRAASEELSLELDDDHSNNSTEESNVATDIVPPVDVATSRVPLHCFSTFVGHLDVHMSSHIDVSGPVNSDKANIGSDNQQRGARQEAQKKIASAQRMLSGCVLSVLDASPTATSSEREESTQHAALGLRMIATTLVSATEPPHYLEGRAAVECRKLLHKLAQQSRWRGILWNPRTGKAKATLELNRCSREEAHRSGGIARDDDEEGTSGVVNHSLYFSVSWLPYIAPMRWYIQRHCALLVDLDRTIVDNAVAISLAEAEVIRASHVTWLVPTLSGDSGDSGVVVRTVLRPKTEYIYLRPRICEFLRDFSEKWRCITTLATKSTRARSHAILAALADPDGAIFGVPTTNSDEVRHTGDEEETIAERASSSSSPSSLQPQYRIYSAEDILKQSAPYLDAADDGMSHCRRYADVLLRARKSTNAILSSSRICSSHKVSSRVARCVVLDDTPLVWEEADWPHVIPVAAFTLGHRDTATYWSHDEGEIVFQLLQKLVIGNRHGDEEGGDEDCWWSQYMAAPMAAVGGDNDTCSVTANAADVASAAAAVVDEDDEDEDDIIIGNRHHASSSSIAAFPSTHATSSAWKYASDVEDVVPI